jgi:hypothetical protein
MLRAIKVSVPEVEKTPSEVSKASALGQAKDKVVSLAIWSAAQLLKVRRKPEARKLLSWVVKQGRPDNRTVALVGRAWNGLQSDKLITDIRAEHLKRLIERPIKSRNLARLLFLIARFEAIERNAPVAAGDVIARQMVSDVGRERIRKAAAAALEQMPKSVFLLYLQSATSAKAGDFVQASRALTDNIAATSMRKTSTSAENKATKRHFDSLCNSWRVVDLIARENMGWLDAERGASYAQLTSKDIQARAGATTHSWVLDFKEPMLQGRDEAGYINMCENEFALAETLIIKLKLIKEIVREGARKQLTYHNAYIAAKRAYDGVRAELAQLVKEGHNVSLSAKVALTTLQTLILAMDVCRELNLKNELNGFKNDIVAYSKIAGFAEARWIMLPALIAEDTEIWGDKTYQILKAIGKNPERERDLKAYFQWAMHMREFEAAEAIFNKLSSAQRAAPSVLYYVNILQRQSRFSEAINIVKVVHAHMLAKPAQLNTLQHWNLIRRYGELYFLHDTANLYKKVKQPKRPKGVVLVGARNIDQLRKYPLLVLIELKRRGWAVVPLVEGLLPREKCGNKKIDALNGCLTIELSVRPEVQHLLPPVENFVSDPSRGILRWGKLNFDHALLEDARIGRRTFDVDLTCPSLSADLGRLSEWSEHFARATKYAHSVIRASGVRVGLLSLFNSRMPDALFRPYCDLYGDKENFFCLQTANGYENYFTNFSTSISTKCVVRNMTEFSEVRSSSLPIPALFDQFYEANKSNVTDVIERVEQVATIRRTTGNVQEPAPEAILCENKINEWRAQGGKVACLFGRVVCDSAVPYDGGPAHKDIKDWLRHSIDAVRGSDTLLLIKPHPHELNEQIATYLNQYFVDLMPSDVPENVIVLGHRWFDIQSLKRFVDLGLIFNGTTAVELALLEIPAVMCGYFGASDYPVGHIIPKNRKHYENLLQFKSRSKPAPDMRNRAAMWLEYMSNSRFTIPYRYQSRPITNKTVYPPYWIKEDVQAYLKYGDRNIDILADRIVGAVTEPRA